MTDIDILRFLLAGVGFGLFCGMIIYIFKKLFSVLD